LTGLSILGSGQARAAGVEHRDYVIHVDGKECGQSRVDISKQDDGTVVMTAQATARVTQLVFTYRFSNQTTEWWKDGRLIGLKASTDDNGKKTEVTGGVEGNQLRLSVNGRVQNVNADVWTTSFWKLADPKYHNKQLPLLEVDSGREYMGRLEYLGTQPITVGTDNVECYHFRVTGGPNTTDLWFDRFYLLVREEFVESGHRTAIQLMRR
jgi:hypothetical protein